MTEEIKTEEMGNLQNDSKSSEASVLRRIGRILFRMLVAIVIGLALGVGLYYGAIQFYREAIEPIQGYEDRISELERSLEQVGSASASESEDLNQRQAAIEGRLASNAEALASVEALVAAAQEDLRQQRRILNAMGDLESEQDDLTLAVGELALQVEQLAADIAAGDLPAQRVQRTAVYLKAMSMLTRAQLELDRNNLGFAAEQVDAARVIMAELTDADSTVIEPSGDEALVATIIERLDVVIADLPLRPAVASDELEAIWKLFVEALQPVQLDEMETGGQ